MRILVLEDKGPETIEPYLVDHGGDFIFGQGANLEHFVSAQLEEVVEHNLEDTGSEIATLSHVHCSECILLRHPDARPGVGGSDIAIGCPL